MPDDVSRAEKTLRFLQLERVQKAVQHSRLQRYLNKVLKVLVEGSSARSDDSFTGHSTCHRVVNFKGTQRMLGNIVGVRVTEAKPNSFFGEVVQ